ncbi:hypothetical protein [Absidia glauca]|uniref:Uncharacterized protein n=1 Tax=Absidia glauca TaxID=4829 RepID=A0A163K2D2_ABSGL|nr:hypothetical protein [Absidia glauca]
MQLSFKALLLIGTLAGLAMASGGKYDHNDYHKDYHHKGGVIKRTILIDGCTGQPIEKHPYPKEQVDPEEKVDPGFDGTHLPHGGGGDGIRLPHDGGGGGIEIHQPEFDEPDFDRHGDETIFENNDYPENEFDFFNGDYQGHGDYQGYDDYGTYGDDGANLVYRDEPSFNHV